MGANCPTTRVEPNYKPTIVPPIAGTLTEGIRPFGPIPHRRSQKRRNLGSRHSHEPSLINQVQRHASSDTAGITYSIRQVRAT